MRPTQGELVVCRIELERDSRRIAQAGEKYFTFFALDVGRNGCVRRSKCPKNKSHRASTSHSHTTPSRTSRDPLTHRADALNSLEVDFRPCLGLNPVQGVRNPHDRKGGGLGVCSIKSWLNSLIFGDIRNSLGPLRISAISVPLPMV